MTKIDCFIVGIFVGCALTALGFILGYSRGIAQGMVKCNADKRQTKQSDSDIEGCYSR